jgi:hypothetical protein
MILASSSSILLSQRPQDIEIDINIEWDCQMDSRTEVGKSTFKLLLVIIVLLRLLLRLSCRAKGERDNGPELLSMPADRRHDPARMIASTETAAQV